MTLNALNQYRKLSELGIEKFKRQGIWRKNDPYVCGLSSDSNDVRPGYIFFAINGHIGHGANFAIDAIDRGAVLIVTDGEGARIISRENDKIPVMIVLNTRKNLAEFATNWYDGQPKNQIAVTGTNGKTSVCHFTQQLWQMLGFRSTSIGTLGVMGSLEFELKNTTPDPIVLHQILRNLVMNDIDYVSMEASSHGLEQFRLDGVSFKAAAFTNLSRDHLDYHLDEDDYLASKCLLFDRVLSPGNIVVLNLDDPCAQLVKLVSENNGHKVITVGLHDSANLKICDQRYDSDGQTLKISYEGFSQIVRIPLIGNFQATNVLISAALVIALGASYKKVFDLLPSLQPVPGRMEFVGTKQVSAKIFVDYAHTPDALFGALRALRYHTIGRLLLVFGAGGERDIGKRPLMGKIAFKHADEIFITDDNPRNEDPKKIRKEILQDCPSAIEIPDRAEAILTAIDRMQEGDILLIAGKGHETGQIIGDDTLPFNDKEFVSMSLGALQGSKV